MNGAGTKLLQCMAIVEKVSFLYMPWDSSVVRLCPLYFITLHSMSLWGLFVCLFNTQFKQKDKNCINLCFSEKVAFVVHFYNSLF